MEIDRLLVLSWGVWTPHESICPNRKACTRPAIASLHQNFKCLWFSSYLAFCPLHFSFMLSYSIHNLHVRAGISFETLVLNTQISDWFTVMGPEIDRFIYVKACVFGRLTKTPNILASAIVVSIFIHLKLVSVFTVTISSNTINYRKGKWIF